MARQYQVGVAGGVNYEFFLHDDDRIEMVSGVDSVSLTNYQQILEQAKQVTNLMRNAGITSFQIASV